MATAETRELRVCTVALWSLPDSALPRAEPEPDTEQAKRKKQLSEKARSAKRERDRDRSKTRVNVQKTHPRWRELRVRLGFTQDCELAEHLLDSYEKFSQIAPSQIPTKPTSKSPAPKSDETETSQKTTSHSGSSGPEPKCPACGFVQNRNEPHQPQSIEVTLETEQTEEPVSGAEDAERSDGGSEDKAEDDDDDDDDDSEGSDVEQKNRDDDDSDGSGVEEKNGDEDQSKGPDVEEKNGEDDRSKGPDVEQKNRDDDESDGSGAEQNDEEQEESDGSGAEQERRKRDSDNDWTPKPRYQMGRQKENADGEERREEDEEAESEDEESEDEEESDYEDSEKKWRKVKAEPKLKMQLCTECGEFYKKSHKCDHKEKRFPCNVCGRRFVSEPALKVHSYMHSETHEYHCKFCSVSFKTKVEKIGHELIHLKQKDPFRCPHCALTFPTFRKRAAHKKKHVDKNTCKMCGLSFQNEHSFLRHVAVHTGERPFKCSACDMSFKQESHLKSHVRLHTGERPFTCKHCPKAFNHNVSLKSHVQKYHPEEEEEERSEQTEDGETAAKTRGKWCTTGRPKGRPKRSADEKKTTARRKRLKTERDTYDYESEEDST